MTFQEAFEQVQRNARKARACRAHRIPVAIVFLVLAAALTGCTRSQQAADEHSSDAVQARLTNLETRLANVEELQRALDQDVANLKLGQGSIGSRLATLETKDGQALISVTQPGYSCLQTNLGTLFVSCIGVEPYLTGQKIKLSIGNPTTATFEGFRLYTVTGKPLTMFQVDEKTAKHGQYSFTETLQPGQWKDVSFVVAPATPEDVTFLSATIELNNVWLRIDPKSEGK